MTLHAGPESPHEGLTNAHFAISDILDEEFGWTTLGSGTVSNGEAVLNEDDQVFTRFSQNFVVPAGATALRFNIVNTQFVTSGANPPDAFEVALLDANTMASLIATASGLTNTDAFLNIQQTGEMFASPQVILAGPNGASRGASAESPMTVIVDMTGVAARTEATLFFDLLGFGPAGSSVVIDDVVLLGTVSPLLDASLAIESDSGGRHDAARRDDA